MPKWKIFIILIMNFTMSASFTLIDTSLTETFQDDIAWIVMELLLAMCQPKDNFTLELSRTKVPEALMKDDDNPRVWLLLFLRKRPC